MAKIFSILGTLCSILILEDFRVAFNLLSKGYLESKIFLLQYGDTWILEIREWIFLWQDFSNGENLFDPWNTLLDFNTRRFSSWIFSRKDISNRRSFLWNVRIRGSWRFANEYSFDRIFRDANIFSNTLSSILAKIFEFRISSILLQNIECTDFREFSLRFFESPLMKEDFYSNGWSFLLKTFFVLSFFFPTNVIFVCISVL